MIPYADLSALGYSTYAQLKIGHPPTVQFSLQGQALNHSYTSGKILFLQDPALSVRSPVLSAFCLDSPRMEKGRCMSYDTACI